MSMWTEISEVGRRGGAKIMRSLLDVATIFKNAADFTPHENAISIEVDVNGYGILDERFKGDFLYTYNINVCSGIALVTSDNQVMALTHLYSGRAHFLMGQTAVESHARNCWKKLEALLPPDASFRAVAFGGQKKFDHVPEGIPSISLFNQYYNQYDGKFPQLGASSKHLPRPQVGTEGFEVLGQGAVACSRWLADGFFDAACDSGRIYEMTDMRYMGERHHVIIDRRDGEVYITKLGDGVKQRLLNNTEIWVGGHLFSGSGIHPEIASESKEVQLVLPFNTNAQLQVNSENDKLRAKVELMSEDEVAEPVSTEFQLPLPMNMEKDTGKDFPSLQI